MRAYAPLALAIAGILASGTIERAWAETESTQSAARSHLVRFVETGALYYAGEDVRFAATSPDATGSRKYDDRTPAANAYREYLLDLHKQRHASIEGLLGRQVPIQHNYHVLYSAVAMELTDEEADRVRALPGVARVDFVPDYELATDAGPTLIGAVPVWNGSAFPPPSLPNRGENVVAAVFDTGANSAHPSFGNDASCGFSAMFPKQVSAKDCLEANCVGGNPEASNSHGVHVAGTVLGNRLVPPLSVVGVNLRWEISGVAPCGRLRQYKVCPTNSCNGTAILRAIQESIVDQVDAMNFSISGGTNPWNDNDRGFLDMVNAGIFVVAAAGNTNDTITNPVGQVNHRGPWVMSVANTTHDRIEGNRVDVSMGGPQNVPSQAAQSAYPSTTTAPAITSLSLGNELGCNPGYPAGSMTGRIAVISRGTCTFTEKATNAANAGAVGVLLYNNVGGPPVTMGALAVPGVMVGNASGLQIRDHIQANPSAQITITTPVQRFTDPSFADVLSGGSLRGPNNSFDVTKPDIAAPGTNIYAAAANPTQFAFLSGTSMASPHVAGAGMLVISSNPSWTVQEVKSALQMTANRTGGLKDTGLAPWDPDDVGNGRTRVNLAVNAGLVMNETFANFLAANPASGGQPRNLNLPSLRHTSCNGSCTFTRTFRNTKSTPVTWNAVLNEIPAGTQVTVTPSSFSFTGNTAETVTVTIQVGVTAPPPGLPNLSFGYLIFRDAAGELPDANLTVAVRGTSDTLFSNGFE